MIVNKYLIALVACTIMGFGTVVYSQVGIGTTDAKAILHIDSAESDKMLRIENSDNREIFTILQNGNIGIGVENPTVKVDLRESTNSNGAVAIGTTKKEASEVGPGVLRYDEESAHIHYSDGVEWRPLAAVLPSPCVTAINNYEEGYYPSNEFTVLSGFEVLNDTHDSFEASTSTFTAPVDRLYVLSFTISFKHGLPILKDTVLEGIWVSSSGQAIKCIQSYPQSGRGQVCITCAGTLHLKKGETVTPQIRHSLEGSRTLRVEARGSSTVSGLDFNRIAIYAQ